MKNRLEEVLQNNWDNYIYPFFWLHGEDEKTLVEEIDKIEASGIRALCVESRPHEDFCGPKWWTDMELILKECKRRGMQVWLLDDKHFPSGYANGLLEKKYPHLARWGLTEQHTDVSGPVTDGSLVVSEWMTEEEDEIVAVLACEREKNSDRLTGNVFDFTNQISDGMVYFDLPEGVFRFVFLIKTRSGVFEPQRYYCDPLSSASMDVMIEAVYQPHYERFQEYFGDTFAGFFSDEPCFGNNYLVPETQMGVQFAHFPWTDGLLAMLRERLGQNVVSLLPAIWFELGEETARVRTCYMDLVTKLYQENFCEKLGNWSREHGVIYIGHIIEDNGEHTKTGRSAGHFFRSMDGQDMAGVDVVLNQIIPGLTEYNSAAPIRGGVADPVFFHYTLAKLGASHAHIQPEKQGRAMCEIYGAFGWAEGLKMMKWLTDHMLVRGINHFVPHAFSPKYPDPDCPPHFYARGANPQYRQFRLLMDYMNRACHLFSGGVHVASAGILYHAEAEWSGGVFMKIDEPAKALYDNQLDYDFISLDYLQKAEIDKEQKVFRLSGETYPCMIVPYSEFLPEAAVRKLADLSEAGICVIYVNGVPKCSCESASIAELVRPSETLHVVPLDELAGYVRNQGFGDVAAENAGLYLRAFHYRSGGMDLYMLTNEDIHHRIETELTVRAFCGGDYIQYDLMENKAVVRHVETDKIPLLLEPYQSIVLLFGEIPEGIPEDKHYQTISEQVLACAFDVSVAEEEELPVFRPYKTMDSLVNMTGKDTLPRFSGHIRYSAEFECGPIAGEQILLDLGTVGETASVTVNGVYVGDKLVPPYQFDITEMLKEGTNKLCVTVTNHLGHKIRDTFSKYHLYEPSGLLGPVKLVFRKEV